MLIFVAKATFRLQHSLYCFTKICIVMAEIQEISLGRMNNGAHYMFVADILARAEEHASLSTKLSK